jgi:excisionase family DNA binding protein
MSAGAPRFTYPLSSYAMPPAGLSPEWETVYNALRQPLSAVDALARLYARSGDHPPGRELLRSWYKTLSRSCEAMPAVMAYLRGRAERTEKVGIAIEAAIAPFRAALSAAVCIPPPPLPRRLWPKNLDDKEALSAATTAWEEETARNQWAELGVVKGIDAGPLLEDLCKVVTADNAAGVRLGNLIDHVTVDRLGRVTIKGDSGVPLRVPFTGPGGPTTPAVPQVAAGAGLETTKTKLARHDDRDETKSWLTVTEAAAVSGIDKGTISRLADQQKLKNNGKKGRERRIDSADLNRYQLDRIEKPEPVESDKTVERKLNKAQQLPG